MCSIGGLWTREAVRGGETAARLVRTGARLRGDWAAGVWVQRARGPYYMRSLDVWRVALRAEEQVGTMFLTHTRLPTSGGYGKACAQPLRKGNVVTTHNGHVGLGEAQAWAGIFGTKLPADVDSAVFTAVAELAGAARTIRFADRIGGVSGLAVWDGKVLGVTGDAFVWARYRGGIVWASTREMLPAKCQLHARSLVGDEGRMFAKYAPGEVYVGEVESAGRYVRYSGCAQSYHTPSAGTHTDWRKQLPRAVGRQGVVDNENAEERWEFSSGGVWHRVGCDCEVEHPGISCDEYAENKRIVRAMRAWRPGSE